MLAELCSTEPSKGNSINQVRSTMGLSAPQPTTGGVHLIQHLTLVLGFLGMVHGHPEQSEQNNGAAVCSPRRIGLLPC